jgi:hypothetical protein
LLPALSSYQIDHSFSLSTRYFHTQNLHGNSCSAVPQLCPSARLLQSPKGKPSKSGCDFKGLLVAGARNHQYLRSRASYSVEAASLGQLLSQVLMVVGGGNRLKLLFRAVA